VYLGTEIRKVELAQIVYICICTVLSGVSVSAMVQLVLTDASKVGTHVCNLGIDHILLP
jgi:hypothetical protein